MTGAFLRVKRDGRFVNIEVEHLTDDERIEYFESQDKENIIVWLHLVCNKLAEVENVYFEKIEE